MQHFYHSMCNWKTILSSTFIWNGENVASLFGTLNGKGGSALFDSELRKNLNFWTRRTILRCATKWSVFFFKFFWNAIFVKPFRFRGNSVAVVVYMDRVPPVYNRYIGSLHYQPNHLPHHSCHHNCCRRIDNHQWVAGHGMASVSTEYLNDEQHDMQQNYGKVLVHHHRKSLFIS